MTVVSIPEELRDDYDGVPRRVDGVLVLATRSSTGR